MTIVVDASVVVSALVDSEWEGRWAEDILASEPLASPHLLLVETSNILRRSLLARHISEETAALAHADLLQLRVELFPYDSVALRIWELRGTVTAYDAWYVAVAEALECPLATLDRKLARASGPRCIFKLPPRAKR